MKYTYRSKMELKNKKFVEESLKSQNITYANDDFVLDLPIDLSRDPII